MGEVFLGEDTRLKRKVALKRLKKAQPDSDSHVRTLHEARAAAREQLEVTLEVAHDRVHLEPGVGGRDRPRGCPQRRLAHVERHEAPQAAAVAERVQEEPGLL